MFFASKAAEGDPASVGAMVIISPIVGYLFGCLVLLILGIYYYINRMITLKRLIASVVSTLLPVLSILIYLILHNK
jgi:hypothetical protein